MNKFIKNHGIALKWAILYKATGMPAWNCLYMGSSHCMADCMNCEGRNARLALRTFAEIKNNTKESLYEKISTR